MPPHNPHSSAFRSADGSERVEHRTWRAIALTLVGAILVWLILTRSLAASLAERSPETVLALRPNEPRALLSLAKTQLAALQKVSESQAQTPPLAKVDQPTPRAPPSERLVFLSQLAEAALRNSANPAASNSQSPQRSAADATPVEAQRTGKFDQSNAVRVLIERALGADPFNADALGILAQLVEREGDITRTEALMRAAAQLSIRESYAVYWLLQKALSENDQAAVLRSADTLLRTRGRAGPLVVPVLAQLAEKGASTDVVELLKTNPPWRPVFFGSLTQSITDARTPLYLLLGLQGTPYPPTPKELSAYINFLISKQFHELAYYTWLQFLPTAELAKITPLYNPSFERTLTGLPFDWSLAQGSGATSEIRPRPNPSDDQNNTQALFVEFSQGRVEFPGVGQLTLLSPGSYTLKGQYKGMVVGKRGLVWRISCAGKTTLAESDVLKGDVNRWREFMVTFSVPPEGCRAQHIRLDLDARSASEKLVSGSMWFDDLALTRVRNSDPTARPAPEL